MPDGRLEAMKFFLLKSLRKPEVRRAHVTLHVLLSRFIVERNVSYGAFLNSRGL